MSQDNFSYSKIKDIWIQLPFYKFAHGANNGTNNEQSSNSDSEDNTMPFVGRKSVARRLKLLISGESGSSRGVYLITGYRGMGKTKLVNKVLNGFGKVDKKGEAIPHTPVEQSENKSKSTYVKALWLSLSQNEVQDIDLLQQIARKLTESIATQNEHNTNFKEKLWRKQKPVMVGMWILVFISIFSTILIVAKNRLVLAAINEIIPANLQSIAYIIPLGIGAYIATILSNTVYDIINKLVSEATEYLSKRHITRIIISIATGIIGFYILVLTPFEVDLGIPFSLRFSQNTFNTLLSILTGLLLIFTSIWVFRSKNRMNNKDTNTIKNRLTERANHIQQRLYGSLEVEQQEAPALGNVTVGPAATVRAFLSTLSTSEKRKRTATKLAPVSAKELEYALSDLISDYTEYLRLKNKTHKSDQNIQLVIVVDELDKVEPDYHIQPAQSKQSPDNSAHLLDLQTRSRMRQQTIARLLANLKNFLSTVDAKFIFIGGRGMYDASLADIADRESFYSSIFHEVLYVESFFKDKLSDRSGITQIVESYLVQLLAPKEALRRVIKNPSRHNTKAEEVGTIKDLVYLLQKDKNQSDSEDANNSIDPRLFKYAHTLQNLVGYLTYRSNGSPKKLIELLDNLIYVRKGSAKKESTNVAVYDYSGKDKKTGRDNADTLRYYLRITYKDQYEINLSNSFFRPYTISSSHFLKGLGDKLLFSSAFLIDHVMKFHRSAFSLYDLELIPDVILGNQDANFRFFFRKVMQFMLLRHVRITTNGMSQYKFLSRTANEIQFLSKISEPSSAAFNFTLDESYHLKVYYKRLLLSKKQEYADSYHKDQPTLIHSISYLRSIIADLHYYDGEYRDAVTQYTDAIQPFREYLGSTRDHKPTHQFVIYANSKLCLGLSLERIESFEKAYSIYRSLTLELKRFAGNPGDGDDGQKETDWELPYKRMETFLRPHIALLGAIEKGRHDGITSDNLQRNFEEYVKFLGLEPEGLFPLPKCTGVLRYNKVNHCSLTYLKDNQDKKRNILLLVEYFHSVGSILFFKNHLIWQFMHGDYAPSDIITRPLKSFLDNSDSNQNNIHYLPSHTAYLYYSYALRYFIEPFLENLDIHNRKPWTNSSDFIVETINNSILIATKPYANALNAEQTILLGELLGKLGDTIFSMIREVTKEECVEVLRFLHETNKQEGFDKTSWNSSKFEENSISIVSAIKLWETAANFVEKRQQARLANTNREKVLHALRAVERDILHQAFIDPGNCNAKQIDTRPARANNIEIIQTYASRILRNSIDIAAVGTRNELEKYQSYFPDQTERTKYPYQHLSSSDEVKTLLLIVESIKNRVSPPEDAVTLMLPTNAYNTVSSMYARVSELIHVGFVRLRFLKSELANLPPIDIQKKGQTTSPPDIIKEITNWKNSELSGRKLASLIDYETIIKYSLFSKDTSSKLYIDSKLNNYLFISNLADTIFAFTDAVRILNIYGTNYIFSHSYLARVHRGLANACRIYLFLEKLKESLDHKITNYKNLSRDKNISNHLIKLDDEFKTEGWIYDTAKILKAKEAANKLLQNENDSDTKNYFENFIKNSDETIESLNHPIYRNFRLLDSKIKELLGDTYRTRIGEYTNLDLARIHYEQAIELHSGGRAYRETLRDMYVLEDDFHDTFVHFCAALERFQINTGRIDKELVSIKKRLTSSRSHTYGTYLNEPA